MHRQQQNILFMIATILVAVQVSRAQTYPPGYTSWPMDSVINRSVLQYTVQGDTNYTSPSTFIWGVYGGTLYYDEQATMMAGNGLTDTVQGNAANQTSLWVKWDGFDTPRDTGFVYLCEISSKGCRYQVSDPRSYSGLRIKVSAPPDVRFIAYQTNLCSYDTSTMVIIEIKGMPPFDLKYTLNGKLDSIHVVESDMRDWDNNGLVDNIAFEVKGFNGTTTPLSYNYVLIEASSGGVPGKILPDYSSHTVNIFVAPPAPVIAEDNTQITYETKHEFTLFYKGLNPAQWFWAINDSDSMLVDQYDRSENWDYTANVDPGQYFFTNRYIDINGCYSPYDSLWIEVFDLPTISFSTPDNLGNCSAVQKIMSDKYVYLSDMMFDFNVVYTGATYYTFKWCVKDYDGNLVGDIKTESFVTLREFLIQVEHQFENTAQPPVNRYWTIEILEAKNYEGIIVDIKDGIRRIEVHPKPEIMEDINFAN